MVAINFWPILISMILSVVLGFIWYGPLFGKQWMRLSGITMPDNKPGFNDMLKPIIISLVGTFLLAVCLTYLLEYKMAFLNSSNFGMSYSGVSTGVCVAFLSWLGFIVPSQLNFVAWEGRPWKLFFIHTGYWLVLLVLTAVVIGF
jgi:hypothetical protein